MIKSTIVYIGIALLIFGCNRSEVGDPKKNAQTVWSFSPKGSSEVSAASLSDDGRLIGLGLGRRVITETGARVDTEVVIRVLDAATGESKADWNEDAPGLVVSLAFSRDGRFLASGHDNMVVIWDISKRQKIRQISLSPSVSPAVFLCFSHDGQFLAVSGQTVILVYDLKTGSETVRINGPWISALGSGLGGQWLAGYAGTDNDVRIYTEAGKLINQLKAENSVTSVMISPDGKKISAVSPGRTEMEKVVYSQWDTLGGQALTHKEFAFGERGFTVSSAVISRDSQLVAVGNSWKVTLYRVSDATKLATYPAGSVYGINTDKAILLAGTRDEISVFRILSRHVSSHAKMLPKP